MDFNYFDMIGCGEESFLFPLMGIIFFPVLFPLYLVLKILVILIDFLSDLFSSLSTNKKIENNNNKDIKLDEDDTYKKEQIEKQLKKLKEEKRRIEDKIMNQEQKLSQNIDVEFESLQEERGLSLKLKKTRK